MTYDFRDIEGPLVIVEAGPSFGQPETPEDLQAKYAGVALWSRTTFAQIRHDAGRMGIKHVFLLPQERSVHLGPLDAEEFTRLVGRKPEQDDLERVNCTEVGKTMHRMCGWCDGHGQPRFECGCL
jgi:hypothetical protein